MYNTGIPSFSLEDINAMRFLFRKYDTNKDGLLSVDDFKNLITEFAHRPEPYQITMLFGREDISKGLSEDQFVTWYCAFSINFVELAYLKFDLLTFEKMLRMSGQAYAAPAQTKDSFIRFYLENQHAALDKEIRLRVMANKEMMSKQYQQFSLMLGRQTTDVFFALRFLVTANAGFIAGKLRELIALGIQHWKGMSPQQAAIANLFVVSVVNNDTTVAIIVECKFPLISELYKVFEEVLQLVYLSVAIKSQQIRSILENNLLNNGFGFEADLRLDSLFLNRLKDLARNNIEQLLNSPDTSVPGALMLLFLFEELKLEAKFHSSAELLKSLGVPEQVPIQQAASGIKNQLNLKAMMEAYLPGSYELLQMIKNNGAPNIELGLYSRIAGILLNFKLDGMGQFFDLVI